jgi:hypothetical protein
MGLHVVVPGIYSTNSCIDHFFGKSFLSRNAVYGFRQLIHSKLRLTASFIHVSTLFLSLEKQTPSCTSESLRHLNMKSATQVGAFHLKLESAAVCGRGNSP